jgi:hypothetical protein
VIFTDLSLSSRHKKTANINVAVFLCPQDSRSVGKDFRSYRAAMMVCLFLKASGDAFGRNPKNLPNDVQAALRGLFHYLASTLLLYA